jgi:uroporphyrinogen decarboxylase
LNPRERYLETLLFGTPDKIPLIPQSGRISTREAWYSQGLSRNIPPDKIPEYGYRQAGGTLPWPEAGKEFHVSQRMIPMFEEKILEERKTTKIVQDWKGNICEIGRQHPVEYLRNPVDFVTRRWIKCPVETRADWEQMKQRYNPDDKTRYPDNPRILATELKERTWPVQLLFSGPFWQLREWLGFEELCLMFYEDPEFVRDMIRFWTDYISQLLQNTFLYFIPDEVHIEEDMAYKGSAMISPAMVREFLLPTWIQWGEIIRAAGVPLYGMDSDGFIAQLIPFWIEAGFTHCDPMEVAAGNDINVLRNTFGKKMAFCGGIDKRAMAKGGKIIEAELARNLPVIKDGGFIPQCDHLDNGIPPDVSWPNYVHYTKLLAEATGWLQG